VRVFIVLAHLLLSACSMSWLHRDSPTGQPPAPEEHAARVAALKSWRILGRVSIQRGDQGFAADLDWQHEDGGDVLRLMAPLGAGTYELRRGPSRIELLTPDGERFSAGGAEELMAARLGWSFPLTGAGYWVRGIPAPEPTPTQENFDERHRRTDFAQDGWRISVLSYLEDLDPALPRKLYLQHDDLKVRLVIKNWKML
jgi:outer membrane lipoprotein LolB